MRSSSVPRSDIRTRLQGRALYYQGAVQGAWELIDLSEGGFQAQGPIDGLDLSTEILVRVEHETRSFSANIMNVWRRRTPNGETLHGWEIVDLSEASSVDLEQLLEEDRPTDPSPLDPPKPSAVAEKSAAREIPLGAWAALLAVTAFLLACLIALQVM